MKLYQVVKSPKFTTLCNFIYDFILVEQAFCPVRNLPSAISIFIFSVFFFSKFQFSFWISHICCWFSSSGLELFPYFIHMLGFFFLYPLCISILSDGVFNWTVEFFACHFTHFSVFGFSNFGVLIPQSSHVALPLCVSHASLLWFVHLLGWIPLLVSFGSCLAELLSLDNSAPSK